MSSLTHAPICGCDKVAIKGNLVVVVSKFKHLKEKLNQQKFGSLYLKRMFI